VTPPGARRCGTGNPVRLLQALLPMAGVVVVASCGGGARNTSVRSPAFSPTTTATTVELSSSLAARDAEAESVCAAFHPSGNQPRLEFEQPFTVGRVVVVLQAMGAPADPWTRRPGGEFAARCTYAESPAGPTTTAVCDGGAGIAWPAGIVEYFVDQQGDASSAMPPGKSVIDCGPRPSS
jgi:hypothetical protein